MSSLPPARPSTLRVVSNNPDLDRWEGEWVRALLADFAIDFVCDPELRTPTSGSLLVISGDVRKSAETVRRYLGAVRDQGGRAGLIHISDEWFAHPTDFYAQAAFVYRNHWRSDFESMENVHYLPLGYPAGMSREGLLKTLTDRTHLWCFVGEKKQSRDRMLRAARALGPGFEHLTSKWEDAASLDRATYRSLLSDTVFAFCPAGNSTPDTFRMYEALEAGCIPIVEDWGGSRAWSELLWPPSLVRVQPWRPRRGRSALRKLTRPSYWDVAFGPGFPLPRVCHWENLPTLVAGVDRPALAAAIEAWWRHVKLETRGRLTAAIQTKLGVLPTQS